MRRLKTNRRSFLKTVLLIFVCLIVVAFAYRQLEHRYNYGHFVPYGLHVDVLSRDAWIGIPGQKKMYWAELSNFSVWPVKLEGCDFVSDTLQPGTDYPYAVQRWDNATNNWQTIIEPNGDYFCKPMPLSMANTRRISRRLWPGMYVQVISDEATGAREPFQKDDKARFVVFKRLGNEPDWRDAVLSAPFIIEDDVVRDEVQFRIKH